jgi:6-pyruvoyltetrahydropterin/6-carboxytetrahydropterin synthase
LKENETRSSIGLYRSNHHFSASHFIRTNEFNESIHGHNYYVEVKLSGFLGLDGLIHDYVGIDKILKNIIVEWDHYVLLPSENKAIQIDKKQNNCEIHYDNRFYSIPSDEIRFLKCTNITTENLAKVLTNKLNNKLRDLKMIGNITSIQIKIWETPTYFASHTIQL